MLKHSHRLHTLPWFSAVHLACLVGAAAIHQRPEVLRPLLLWFNSR